ncbi:MAG: hypothetical protein CVT48_03955 [Thermoplasmata archaeon HGW-Thermoplasmata-1]|nr:MAG: hypothetical protein CVT48_03955 [Thermoplasmata archaeon HGW-Thermoplasmata-1]
MRIGLGKRVYFAVTLSLAVIAVLLAVLAVVQSEQIKETLNKLDESEESGLISTNTSETLSSTICTLKNINRALWLASLCVGATASVSGGTTLFLHMAERRAKSIKKRSITSIYSYESLKMGPPKMNN